MNLDKYATTNRRDAVKQLVTSMKGRKFREIARYALYKLDTDATTYIIWRHEDTGDGVLTITTELGETLVYQLQMVKLEEL